MGKPRRRSSGRWDVQIRLAGIPAESRSFDSYQDALAWRDQRTAELRVLQRQQRRLGRGYVRRSVGDLIEHFLAVELPRYPNRKTAKVYRSKLVWWQEKLGQIEVQDLTTADIASLRDELAQSLTAASVNRYLAPLSVVLNLAAGEWMWIPTNPMAGLRRLREAKRRVIVEGEEREPYLDATERGRLLDAIQVTGNRNLCDLVVLALSCGARRGELLGLTWRDVRIDPAEKVVTLSFIDTKNGDSRSVDVVGPGFDVLIRRRKVRRLGNNHVFPAHRGSGPACFWRQHWVEAREEAGFPNLRFHDLRHVFASELVMSGATLAEVAEVLGHKTLAMVRRYAHFATGHTASVSRRAAARMWGG